MDNKELLVKLNKLTRREMTEDEVYIFPVVLCDNEIDRDTERFSETALNDMKTLFIGITGIFDHNPKGENQTARIFETELVTDKAIHNSLGEEYMYLKGYAYMVRTDANKNLISEIEGGIKKEVSVSCKASEQICSVCGADLTKKACIHRKGREYDGKLCYTILNKITDAYEWSFVAVPAQKKAGVTKSYTIDESNCGCPDTEREKIMNECRSDICSEITRLAFSLNPVINTLFEGVTDKMSLTELVNLKKALKKELKNTSNKNICGALMRISVSNSNDTDYISEYHIGGGTDGFKRS